MNIYKYSITFLSVICIAMTQTVSAQNFALQVKDSTITYSQDARGNRILDFSYCGYRNSEQDIPSLENVVYVSHRSGDASEVIQRAIDYVSSLKPDRKGFRGAVLLDKGVFSIDKSLLISASGVVLRGMDKNETVLLKRGVDRAALLRIEGRNNQVIKDTFNLVSSYIPVNATMMELSSGSNLQKGDRVKVLRPSTKEWIASMGCDIFGGGISALGWKPEEVNVYWDRTVKEVTGNVVTLNAPLTAALDAEFGGAKVFSYQWTGRITDSGIENLTLVSDYNKKYPKDEDHCWTGVSIENAENCWVRMVNFKHFAGSAVMLQPTASQVTVEDCISKEPVSEIGGLRRSTFLTLGQQTLFQRCYTEDGIHDFAVGYCAPGPNAFVQCVSLRALGFSGSIDTWACGLLFDIVDIDGHNLTLKNLGQSRNGAGWATANSLLWQCTAAELECFSPAKDAPNRAYGCWGQFSGDGEWDESNNHVRPRSLFYAQLEARLNEKVSARARILPRNTSASSSPSVEDAAALVKEAYTPRLTMDHWIEQAAFVPSVNPAKLLSVDKLKTKRPDKLIPNANINIVNGLLLSDGCLMTGGRQEVQWWNGKLNPIYLPKAKPHITRFVPGREGYGLTDRVDSVVFNMKKDGILVFDHNYGLWTDRRRDDHQRIRRRDGDVWAPFYEQPFARSGEGLAWDGLSKYDLNRPNAWYWLRLKEFADKGEKEGLLLFHENFFQHNIIEAGAHWVDCPWRSANNINETEFPEPVPFAGDKRIFMADLFYDISNPVRKKLYRTYIRQCLNNFSENKNVVQLISAEFTGPQKFVEFWLDVIAEWQTETGKNAMVALSTTKDVQDAILSDPKRAAIVDIIDIRYWHYKNDGTTYQPKGGQSLAPRQHARLTKVGKVTFDEAYRAVREYRQKYPDKAVTYYAQNYPDMAWAVFMAGGSCPVLPTRDLEFLSAAAQMHAENVDQGSYKKLVKSGTGIIIFSQTQTEIPIQLEAGKYELKYIDSKSGQMTVLSKTLKGGQLFQLKVSSEKVGAYWFKRQN